MLLDVGEQIADRAVDMAKALPELLLIDDELRQTHARDPFIQLKQPLVERQLRLHRRMELEPLCIPRMHVGDVQIEELIRLVERLDLHDRAVDALC